MICTLKVKETKEGVPYIKLPTRILNRLGWKLGEKLEWVNNKDGSYTLKKYEQRKGTS